MRAYEMGANRLPSQEVAPWSYEAATGRLFYRGSLVHVGYSGHAEGVNNPQLETVPMVGPIPRGTWAMGKPFLHPRLGPVSIPLTRIRPPIQRSGFLIHGDNRALDRSASNGCIIMPRHVRERLAASPFRLLVVW